MKWAYPVAYPQAYYLAAYLTEPDSVFRKLDPYTEFRDRDSSDLSDRGEESDDRNRYPVPEPIDPERVTEVVGSEVPGPYP